MAEALEPRRLLSSGALEVWGGNALLTSPAANSPSANGFTQLGFTNSQNTSVTFSAGSTHYAYFLVVTRAEVNIDDIQAVVGSSDVDQTPISTGNVANAGNLTVIDGKYGTIGDATYSGGTYAGYALIRNSLSATGVHITIGSIAPMISASMTMEADYLPGGTTAYSYSPQFSVFDNGFITSAQIQSPTGKWYTTVAAPAGSTPSDVERDMVALSYPNSTAVNSAFPIGTYTVMIHSPLGTTSTAFTLSSQLYPVAKSPTGWVNGETGVSTSESISWSAITDKNTNGIEVNVLSTFQSDVVNASLATYNTSYGPMALTEATNYCLELITQNTAAATTNAAGYAWSQQKISSTIAEFETSGGTTIAADLFATSLTTKPTGGTAPSLYPGDIVPVYITGAGNEGGNAIGVSKGKVVPVAYEFVLSKNGTWGATGNIVIGTGDIPGWLLLGAESIGGARMDVQIPTTVAAGSYYILEKVDSTGVVSGTNPSISVAKSTSMVQVLASAASQTVFITQPPNKVAATQLGALKVGLLDSNYDVDLAGTATLTLALASEPPGARLSSTFTATAVNGIATFTGVTLSRAGTYSLQAKGTGLTPSPSDTFVISPAAATHLVIGTVPANATAGTTLGAAVVEVEDAYGNLVTSTSTVSLSLGKTVSGATLAGTLSATSVNGVATFSNLSLTSAGTYSLVATDGALKSATSGSFVISAASAAKLEYIQQPTNGTVGTLNPITIAVEDKYGNIVTSSTATVTLLANAGPAALGGTTTATVTNGVATFDAATAPIAGTYTVYATSGSLAFAPTSNTFVITS